MTPQIVVCGPDGFYAIAILCRHWGDNFPDCETGYWSPRLKSIFTSLSCYYRCIEIDAANIWNYLIITKYLAQFNTQYPSFHFLSANERVYPATRQEGKDNLADLACSLQQNRLPVRRIFPAFECIDNVSFYPHNTLNSVDLCRNNTLFAIFRCKYTTFSRKLQ